jgi:glucose/mannose-6-phosphate isomerase
VMIARGNSPLAQMMSLVLLGDFMSVYLAFLNGVDPTAVELVGEVKAALVR